MQQMAIVTSRGNEIFTPRYSQFFLLFAIWTTKQELQKIRLQQIGHYKAKPIFYTITENFNWRDKKFQQK